MFATLCARAWSGRAAQCPAREGRRRSATPSTPCTGATSARRSASSTGAGRSIGARRPKHPRAALVDAMGEGQRRRSEQDAASSSPTRTPKSRELNRDLRAIRRDARRAWRGSRSEDHARASRLSPIERPHAVHGERRQPAAAPGRAVQRRGRNRPGDRGRARDRRARRRERRDAARRFLHRRRERQGRGIRRDPPRLRRHDLQRRRARPSTRPICFTATIGAALDRLCRLVAAPRGA